MLAICHSYYSLQTGVVSPKAWVDAAVERGYTALALADVNGLYGAVAFFQAALQGGVKPIVGALLELSAGRYCTVLVKHAEGYRQLCRLLTARHTWEYFTLAAAASSGAINGLIFLADRADVVTEIAPLVAADSLYALAPVEPARGTQPSLWALQPADVSCAFVPDAWFLEPQDQEAFDCLRGLRRLSGRDRLPAPRYAAGAVLPSAAEWRRRYPDQRRADRIIEMCTFEFTFGEPLLPRLILPRDMTASEHLLVLCRNGVEQRYPSGHPLRQKAEKRLQRELDVIGAYGFADYFLYVNEIVSFARRQAIPTGVRGSAASCLVSYLLAFTQCCPLDHDLYFERFMNPGRRDCPDIDLDVADNRRDEVISFCYRRWGADHVAMVATVQF